MTRALAITLALGLLALVGQGCGGSSHASAGAAGASTTGPGAISAEAQSQAKGDIPDSQVFLTYRNPSAGYSITYPEGWTRKGSGADVTFSDKNNVVHIVINNAGAPTTQGMSSELSHLAKGNNTLGFVNPKATNITAGPAIKATYTTQSRPNPVTGKVTELIVDRYELSKAGKRVTVDLATPHGVDNVDAYRKMINSFHWQ